MLDSAGDVACHEVLSLIPKYFDLSSLVKGEYSGQVDTYPLALDVNVTSLGIDDEALCSLRMNKGHMSAAVSRPHIHVQHCSTSDDLSDVGERGVLRQASYGDRSVLMVVDVELLLFVLVLNLSTAVPPWLLSV